MTVSSCPSCHEPVTVPAGAQGSARVRCPLCKDEFLLSVVLDKLPPALVLLDAPEPTESEVFGEGEIRLAGDAGARSAAARSAFEFEEAAAPKAQRGGAASARPASPRPKRKERNALVETIKIVGGGLLAIPLTALLFLGLMRFGFDPLELASRIPPQYATWLVPENLRTKTTEPVSKKKDTSGGDFEHSAPSGKPAVDKPRLANGEIDPSSLEFARPETPDPLVPDAPDTPVFPQIEIKKPDDLPNLDKTQTPEPKGAPPKEPAGEQPPDNPQTPRRFDLAKNLPPATAADLVQALEEARAASTAVKPALTAPPNQTEEQKQVRRDLVLAYYHALARVGEVVIALDPADPEVNSQGSALQGLMLEVAKSTVRQQLLAALAEHLLANPQKEKRGLCLVGEVKRISPSGRLYEVDVELATKSKTTVTVLAGVDPSGFYKVGSKVLLLGAMVKDPTNNLEGYEGDKSEIGCVHYYLRLTREPETSSQPHEPAKAVQEPK